MEEEAAAPAPLEAQEELPKPIEEEDSSAPAGEEAAVPALLAAQEANTEERRQPNLAVTESQSDDPRQDSESQEEGQEARPAGPSLSLRSTA